MTRHDVKIEPCWFERIRENEKFAEVRYDDQDYQTGDTIRFQRNDSDGMLSWHYVERRIAHVLRAGDGIIGGYVVLSLVDPRVADLRGRLDRAIEREATLERRNAGLRGDDHEAATRSRQGGRLMRHVSQWFSTIPEDEDGSRRWYQRNREWYGGPDEGPESHWRLVVGDLLEVNEHENGDFAGAQFGVDLRMWEDVGQFDYDDTDRWHDHSITVVFWRWGVYFAWRGGLKAGR